MQVKGPSPAGTGTVTDKTGDNRGVKLAQWCTDLHSALLPRFDGKSLRPQRKKFCEMKHLKTVMYSLAASRNGR